MEYRGPKSIFRMVISKHPRASNRNTRARASSHPMSLFLLPSSPLCPLSSTDHSTIFQVLVWSARRYSMYFFGGVKTRYLEYEIEMTEGTLAAQFRILSTRGWLYNQTRLVGRNPPAYYRRKALLKKQGFGRPQNSECFSCTVSKQ